MNKHLLLATFIFCLSVLPGQAQKLQINEIMSSNTHTLLDEDGEFPDWIELINISSQTINLSEYFLTDDLKNPTQWQFPDMELQSGGLLLVFASGKDRKTIPTNWKTIINQGDDWKYLLPTQQIDHWREAEFDDSHWNTGKSGFGYEDGDDETIIPKTISLYMRKEFTIDNPSAISETVLHMDYDDAFVAYINGVEVARANIGTAGDFPAFNAGTTAGHEARMYQGFSPEEFNISNPALLLNQGKNVLAIEVHNQTLSSSDLTAIPFLSVRSADNTSNSSPEILNLSSTYMHTNFKLGSGGDSILIYNTQGQLVDELIYDPFPVDYSIGFKDGDFNTLCLFKDPTPNHPNVSDAVTYDADLLPTFSIAGGIYNSTVSLVLSSDHPDDVIYFTTDGSEPDKYSATYTAPITIENPVSIRARIIRANQTYGKVITNSYLPNYNKELPVVFISTSPDNLWDETKGIYTMGPDASTVFPYHGANFWADWEKPAHVELYFPFEQDGFSIDAGISIHGGGSRGYEQKSLTAYARSIYGDKNISCQVFDRKPIRKFESITFRNSGNDWFGARRPIGSMFRDMMMSSIALNMNLDAADGRPAVLYLNGDYWGIYNIREKLREHFVASNHNLETDEFDMLEYQYSVINGTRDNYLSMLNFIETNDIRLASNYEYLATQMDIPNFIRYQSSEIFFDNWDWPGNNIKFWKDYSTTGRWRWILHDTDFGYGLYNVNDIFYHNTLMLATATDGDEWPNPPWSTLILRKLLENAAFQHSFINTFADHLNTNLKTEKTLELIEHYSSQIESEIPFHVEKWGSTVSDWISTVNLMQEFSQLRPEIIRGYIREYFSISQNQQITLNISGCDDASIYLNTITINEFPWDGIYFNQIPIELTALAPAGYKFVRWEGDLQSTEPKIQVSMETDMSLTAVFEEDDQSGTVVINEIMYNPSNEFDSDDWVELYNNSTRYINLTNWILKDSDDANSFNFAPNTVLAPNEYLVVCREPANFSLIHPETSNVQGPLGFGFSSAGECVRLFDNTSKLVDQVCYASEYPWPTEPNGGGYTLGLNDPNQDNSLASNWFTSQSMNGSPGKANTATGVEETVSQSDQSFLLQNYPNPFTGNTRIPVYSQSNETVNISVFNLEGQLVSTVFQGNLSKGYHTFEWEAPINAPGIYLIKYSGPNHLSVKKAICH
ncbi:MAG: CotH kinase family protein [Mangrovibacterium sp.]